MNSILQDMLANFSPQLFIALIGGFIGGLIGAEDRQQRYGKRLTFLLVVASVIFAGAAVLVVVYPLTVLSNLSAVYSNGARNSVVLSVLVNMLFPNLILDAYFAKLTF